MATTIKPGITFAADDVPVGTGLPRTETLKQSVERLLGTPVEACDSCSSPVVSQPGFHSLVAAADLAYSGHFPLVLTPDAIWLTIAQGFARHVVNNSEELRPLIVPHDGKVMLTVRRDDFLRGSPENPWAEVWPAFCEQIAAHIGPESHNLMVCDFSTTGPTERAASEIVLMDAMQSYFEFRFETLCGIPAVTLEGSVEDWERIRERVGQLGRYNLHWWTNEVTPIIEEFITAAKGCPTLSFWKELYKKRNSSGGPYVSGWLVRLLPYLKQRDYRDGHLTPWTTDLRNFMLMHPVREGGERVGLTHDQLPSSVSSVPFVWRDRDEAFDYQYLAGVMAVTQDAVTKAIRPRVGWAVRQSAMSAPKCL